MPGAPLEAPPMLPPGGTPGEDAPKAQKRAWREANAAKQEWYRNAVSQGYSLDEANRIYSTHLNHGTYDPEYGRTREHGGVPMQSMWKMWQQNGGGLPLGYTFDWGSGQMRHDATSDSDPNSPTGNQTWQNIPQDWVQQRAQYQDWVQRNPQAIQQSGGDPYAAYLRQWSDYNRPGYQRPDAPMAGAAGVGQQGGASGGTGMTSMSQNGQMSSQGFNPINAIFPFPSLIGGAIPGGGNGGSAAGGGQGMAGMPQGLDQMFGNIGDITGEMSQQSRLDTLMQMMNYQRQMQEYGEGRGMQRYARDFWGDIMGVGFDNPEYSLQNYFNQGLGRQAGLDPKGGNSVGPEAHGIDVHDGNGNPVNPDGTPVAPTVPRTPEGRDPIERVREAGNDDPRTGMSAMSSSLPRMNPDGTLVVNNADPTGPSGPRDDTGGAPAGPPGPGGVPGTKVPPMTKVPGTTWTKSPTGSSYGSAPPMPALPNSGYHMLTNGFDPGNDKSWGMLARPAQAIAAQNDAQQSMLKRMMPAGGERDLASAQALNSGMGQIGDLRQSLVGDAMKNIQDIGSSKIFQTPMSASSGAGNSLLGNYMQGQGNNQNYDLGLRNIASNERLASRIPWAQIGASLGGSLAGLLA